MRTVHVRVCVFADNPEFDAQVPAAIPHCARERLHEDPVLEIPRLRLQRVRCFSALLFFLLFSLFHLSSSSFVYITMDINIK